jgi:hypothetical protein
VCACLGVRKGEEVMGQGRSVNPGVNGGCSVAAPSDSSLALGPSSLATPPTSGSSGYSMSQATPAGLGENGSASMGLSMPAWRAGSWPLRIASMSAISVAFHITVIIIFFYMYSNDNLP